MSDYQRTTRECTLTTIHPGLAAAIRTHLEKHGLEGILSTVVAGIETVSTKQKKGLFGGKSEAVRTAVLLTSDWLVCASLKDNDRPGVFSARLGELQVQDYEKSDLYRLAPDTGVDISGLRSDETGTGSYFLGLGPEPAAQSFRAGLKDAVARA